MVNGAKYLWRWIPDHKDKDKPFKKQEEEKTKTKTKKSNEDKPLGIYPKDKNKQI